MLIQMSTLKSHTASGQALGYFFQLERAMSWISKSPLGSTIGIETEDDVVVQLLNGSKILEQDKSSTTTFPFLPSRLDLWKTLCIWLEAIKNQEIDIASTSFYLVTNKTATGSLAEKIGISNNITLATTCLDEIKKTISLLGVGTEAKAIAEKVLLYEESIILNLIQKITFESGSKIVDKNQIVSDLQIVKMDDDSIDSILNELKGWLFTGIVEAWRTKKPAIIERDDFINLKNKLITNNLEKIVNEKIYEIGQISPIIQDSHFNNIYIKQLSIINSEEEEKSNAISDYINSVTKKTQLAKKGYLTNTDIEKFEADLETRWKSIAKTCKILHKNLTPEEIGSLICTETLEHNGDIGDVKTKHYFLTRGTYHLLSEKLKIGWHPDYKNVIASK